MEDKDKEDVREVNRLLEAAGSDYVATERVHWKPGDPVTNTGEALLRADWERELQGKDPDAYFKYLLDPQGFFDENPGGNE